MKKLIVALLLIAAADAYGQSSVKFRKMDAYITNGKYQAHMYKFPKRVPATVAERTLTASVGTTLTFTAAMGGCPLGVAGANSGHYLYISGGTGTAEAVLITGGTCTSGATSGTLTFTPANNHSGAWTIESATAGIQEAIADGASTGVVVDVTGLSGTATIYANPFGTAVAAKPVTLYLGGINISSAIGWTLNGNKRAIGIGGRTGATKFTYTGSGVAVTASGDGNELAGIHIIAASGTDGLKLDDSTRGVFRDFKVSGPPTRGLYLFSDDAASGTAWNTFFNFEVNTAVTALSCALSGAGFVNDNEFVTGILRTSADPGTVALLTSCKSHTFIGIDASNYGGAGAKSWELAGSSAANTWLGGLIDTDAQNVGFTIGANVADTRVIGMLNDAATPVTDNSAANGTQNVFWFTGQSNRLRSLNLQATYPSAGDELLFTDSGNISTAVYISSGVITFRNKTNAVTKMQLDMSSTGGLIPPTVAFANLGTPGAGTIKFCSDCTVTGAGDNTCAGAGTGALAVRINGVWRCFNAQN